MYRSICVGNDIGINLTFVTFVNMLKATAIDFKHSALTCENNEKEKKYLTKKFSMFEKLIYDSGDAGLNAMYMLFSTYVLFFYTDVIFTNATSVASGTRY